MKKTKRVLSIILIIAILLLLPQAALADALPSDANALNTLPMDTSAKAVLLMDVKTRTVIGELNADEKLDVSTISKSMSLLLFIEAIENGQLHLEDELSISVNATKTGGVRAFLDHSETYKVDTLLKCVQMISANDACLALAEAVSGTEEAFVELMNQKAQDLGLTNTYFMNCTGQTISGQYSTARDIATISIELLKHETYYKHSKTYMEMLMHKSGRETELVNPNRLVRSYTGADGIQTGSSTDAGYCLAGSAKRGELGLVCVVLGAQNSAERFNTATQMLDYGFANFTNVSVVRAGETAKKNVEVKGGDKSRVNIVAQEDVNLLVRKGEEQFITKEVEMEESLLAPLNREVVAGKLIIKNNETVIKEINLYPQEDVAERTLMNSFLRVIRLWIR
ncbi:D-alanyl-D-alanine carboxypeptidase [Clostridia bacterium OttesenSCG-928-F22]|nr:D-alanyl-D-alanine carboxypeptidase [Clostridia bacterium OttesenSCG-928-F22]